MVELVKLVTQRSKKFWDWPPVTRAVCVVLTMCAVTLAAFEGLKMAPCISCHSFDLSMNLTLDQIVFKIDKGGNVDLLDSVHFQELEVSDLKSVRLSVEGNPMKKVELFPKQGDNSIALRRKSGVSARSHLTQHNGYPVEVDNLDTPAELGGVRFPQGTKLIIRGYSPGDPTIRLSARAKGSTASQEQAAIHAVFPQESIVLLHATNLSTGTELPGMCSESAANTVLSCEARLRSNLVEIVPDARNFSIFLRFAAGSRQSLQELVLTHTPIWGSEFDFGRLDETENLFTTVRSGEIKLLDYSARREFKLLASDLVQVPRDAVLEVKDLRVKDDGSISVVIEGRVSELWIGWTIKEDESGVFRREPTRIAITVAEWLLSTEWAKNTLWGLLTSAIAAILSWTWKGKES